MIESFLRSLKNIIMMLRSYLLSLSSLAVLFRLLRQQKRWRLILSRNPLIRAIDYERLLQCPQKIFKLLPFFQYASQQWHGHVKATKFDSATFELLSQLFVETNEENFRNAITACDSSVSLTDVSSGLYYASFLGLLEICRFLLERG